jgi:hypothetical protein
MRVIGVRFRLVRRVAVLLTSVAAFATCDDPFDPERVEGVWTSENLFSTTDQSVTGSFTLTLVSTGPPDNLFGQGSLSGLTFSVDDGSMDESGDPLTMTFDFGTRGTLSFDGRADSDTRLSGTLTGTVRLDAGVEDPRFEFDATRVTFTR